ncbi:MAG: hypothetical protein CMK07_01830 [Ponticaulis sp.]|nr:hypothetical protein [Ponticaulis sp.]
MLVGLAVLAAACSNETVSPSSSSEGEQAKSLQPVALDLSTQSIAASCSGCHSSQMNSALPALDSYSGTDLETRFLAYRNQSEGTTVMHRIARGYTPEQIHEISVYLSEDSDD